MARVNHLGRGTPVLAIAFCVLACVGTRSVPPPPPAFIPAPTPVRSIDPGARYAEALVAALASDPLVMHAVETTKGTASYNEESVKLDTTVTTDLSDRDVSMHIVSKKSAGRTLKSDLVVVGKTVYARIDTTRWTRSPRDEYERSHTDIVRPFRLVRSPSLLRYVGLETVDKRKLHHLTAIEDMPYLSLTGQSGTWTRFDIWIEEDGTPVLLKGKISAFVDYGIEITATSELRISKFGGPIEIVAPKS